jgi:hypothetical protein
LSFPKSASLNRRLRTENCPTAILPALVNAFCTKRAWFWIAIAAIAFVLVALLVPHTSGSDHSQPDWLALLTVIFIGVIAPLNLLLLVYILSLCPPPQSPLLASSFQRPPPQFA